MCYKNFKPQSHQSQKNWQSNKKYAWKAQDTQFFFCWSTQDTQSYYSSNFQLFPLNHTQNDINPKHTFTESQFFFPTKNRHQLK